MSLSLATRPRPASSAPRRRTDRPRRVLAVILDRDDVERILPAAIALATEEDRQLCVAIIRPRPLWAMDVALVARLAEESDRHTADLIQLVLATTATTPTVAGRPVISLHLLTGLRGRRRRRVLERIVSRLARHHDAQPLGTWAA